MVRKVFCLLVLHLQRPAGVERQRLGGLKGCIGTNRDCDLPWGTELGTEPALRGFRKGAPLSLTSVVAWVLVGPSLQGFGAQLPFTGGPGREWGRGGVGK